MPSIGHVFYAMCILIPIFYFMKGSKDKFSYKAAFIFLANNYIGPDAAQVWIGTPFHSMLGFLIFAIPLSLVYSYFSRFSLVRNIDTFGLHFVDDKIREVKWKNAYCLCAAGGVCHFFIDMAYHWENNFYLWPGISWNRDEILKWGDPYGQYHVFGALSIVSFVIIIATIIISLYTLSKGYKETFELFLIAAGLMVFFIFGISIVSFGGERDIAVLFHSVVFVLIPLFLLFYVARDIRDNPNQTPDVPKIKRTTLLKIVSLISMIFAGLFLGLSLIGIFSTDTIAGPIAKGSGEDIATIRPLILLLGVLILVVSSSLLVASIGLLFKNHFCRKFVMGMNFGLFIMGFPIAIALFLCEEDVVKMFEKKVNRDQ